MEIGLGPDQFDCSGLVLRALADVMGSEVLPEIRHARQMWQDGQENQKLFIPGQEQPGDLAVFWRTWDTPDGMKRVPAHIAIVTAIGTAEEPLRMLHAQPSAAKVIEAPMQIGDRLLGFLKLAELG